MDESTLIRLFTDLTGESESAGRSVLMYLDVLGADGLQSHKEDDQRRVSFPSASKSGESDVAQTC